MGDDCRHPDRRLDLHSTGKGSARGLGSRARRSSRQSSLRSLSGCWRSIGLRDRSRFLGFWSDEYAASGLILVVSGEEVGDNAGFSLGRLDGDGAGYDLKRGGQ